MSAEYRNITLSYTTDGQQFYFPGIAECFTILDNIRGRTQRFEIQS